MRGWKNTLKALSVGCLAILIVAIRPAMPQSPDVALTGAITSDREGRMEGVVVSAKKMASTITVSVVSNSSGVYSFPAGRLEPGRYQLAIRAAGYELEGSRNIELTPSGGATADLRLTPTHRIKEQLTNAEWMASAPGSEMERTNAAMRPSSRR